MKVRGKYYAINDRMRNPLSRNSRQCYELPRRSLGISQSLSRYTPLVVRIERHESLTQSVRPPFWLLLALSCSSSTSPLAIRIKQHVPRRKCDFLGP
jgi:hypothetical protein